MDNFIVSARKYRPSTFDTVIGQASITNTLKNAIKNKHLAQAFLFCGPRGVGKTTCARILAKTINCESVSENLEACNKCESCTSFNESHSFNIHELDAASNNSVDDIRHLIEQVRIAPQVGNYSIYIIDEVHMLSVSAFNAFLKTLEEPPPYAVFILATTSKQKIIPTILSRCQIFDFSRIQVEDIACHLGMVAEKEGVKAEPDALHIVAQKADGSLRDALSIFDQMVSFGGEKVTYNDVIENLNILDYDYYFKAIDALLERDISRSLLLFDEVLNNGFDGHNYVTGLSEHVRNLLVCKDEATVQLLQVGGKIKARYKEQSQSCPAPMLLDALSLTNKYDISYNASINKRLHVELLFMQLCSLEGITSDPGPVVKIIPPAADVSAKALAKEEGGSKVEEQKAEYKKEEGKLQGTADKPIEATAEPEASVKDEVSPQPVKEQVEEIEESAPKEEESENNKEVQEDNNLESKKAEDNSVNKEEVQEEVQEEVKEEEPGKQPTGEEVALIAGDGNQDGADGPDEYKMQTRSLKDLVKASGEEEKKIAEIEGSFGNKAVTQEAFDEAWGKYAEQIKDEGKHSLFSTMTKRKPVLLEDNKVTLDVDNAVQESEWNSERPDIHEYLRKELDNAAITVKLNVLKTKEDRKPYTSMEKFKRMAEKNPSIEKFRKQLNLDID